MAFTTAVTPLSELRNTSDVKRSCRITMVADGVVGDIVIINGLIGRLMQSVDISVDAIGILDYEINKLWVPKATGVVWVPGDKVYWDATAKKATKTVTDYPLGIAQTAQATGDTTGIVDLQGDPTGRAGARTSVITFPTFTGWTKDGTDQAVVLPKIELPFNSKAVRAYVQMGTAPDKAAGAIFKLNTVALATVAQAAVTGEAEALAIAIAADTDFALTVNEEAAGLGANANIMLVIEENDV